MDLEARIKIKEPEIKEPESTPTRESHPPESRNAGKDEATAGPFPPDDLRFDVLMTFSGGTPILTARELGVTVEGDRIEDAYRHLIEATEEQLALSEGEKSVLSDYPPYTWFKIVEPDPIAYADEATLADEFIGALKALYEFKGSPVEGFLKENPSLTSLLFGAYAAIHEHFEPNVGAALEVVADPEALGDQQLFVLIQTELPRKEARANLAQLDREWWLRELPAAGGKMEIALD